MRKVVLDCAGLDRMHLHEVFAKELNFPQWYGKNLDALYDCLTDIPEDTEVTVAGLSDGAFRQTLLDAANATRRLNILFE